MIHSSEILDLINNREFSVVFYDKHADLVKIDACIKTSYSHNNKTINVLCTKSQEKRTIRLFNIINLNGHEVYR